MATVVAKLGAADANSYVTLAEAEEYAKRRPNAKWHASTNDEKNDALINATMWLETLDYVGERCDPSTTDAGVPQALSWPRKNGSCDGVTATCSFIPNQIKTAQIELALQYIANVDLFPGNGAGGGAAQGTFVSKQKIGSLEIEYDQYAGGTVTSCDNCNDPAIISAFPWIKDLLKCWIGGLNGGVGLILRVRS